MKMNVKFRNGKLISDKDSVEQIGEKVLLESFKIDTDDNIDSLWMKEPTFMFNGEVYTKMTKKELADLEKLYSNNSNLTSQKKVKKEKIINNTSNFIYSSKGTESAEAFIEEYEDEAEALKVYGIPKSIVLAAAILESRHGASYLTKHSNNVFSIKDEGGRCTKLNHRHFKITDDRNLETFHIYNNFQEAFLAYKDFLKRNQRYKSCFDSGMNVSGWLRGLDKAGYSTTPDYGHMLLEIINKHNLAGKRIYYHK
jgi:flagellum-specific peptidoglycan hydrolase FlgJ